MTDSSDNEPGEDEQTRTNTPDEAQYAARQAQAAALLARFAATRAAGEKLGLNPRDSTEILRELREPRTS